MPISKKCLHCRHKEDCFERDLHPDDNTTSCKIEYNDPHWDASKKPSGRRSERKKGEEAIDDSLLPDDAS